jgi:hypothetical protein
MSTHRTADEVEAERLRAMGPDLGPVFHLLSNDVTWLHSKWTQYRQLYAKSQERIDLLNRVAGHFFRVLQDTLFEDVLLHLARLTDPTATGQKQNLTLRRLPALAPPALEPELSRLLGDVVSACVVARDRRNRRLAHRDLGVALATAGDPLPGISRADVEAALAAVRALLHCLERHYWGTETYYQMLLTHGEADELVFWLHEGVRAEESRRERFRTGRPLPEDLEPRKEV